MRTLITVILLTWFTGLLDAQKVTVKNEPKTDSNSSQEDTLANSLLWEISGNGLQKPSYLFGTMHILCTEDAMISDSLQYSIDHSSLMYFEIDMDNPMELLGIFRHIRMKDDKKLSDLLSPTEYNRIKDYFSKNQGMLPFSIMERFKPYFISAMLSESRMPCPTKNGMEEVIMYEVKRQKKEIKGLESIAFQAGVFDSIPYEEQAKDLLKTIDSAGKEDLVTARMLDLYRQQNLNEIDKLTKTEEGGIAAYLELFLYGRNAKWVPVIEKAAQSGPTVFAVGAAHLPGDKGLIRLLQKEGYRLRPMKHALYEKGV